MEYPTRKNRQQTLAYIAKSRQFKEAFTKRLELPNNMIQFAEFEEFLTTLNNHRGLHIAP
jgi:uncharacterized 2Fe-2S/4Fe-4S cluster protein (DUF4445 family)